MGASPLFVPGSALDQALQSVSNREEFNLLTRASASLSPGAPGTLSESKDSQQAAKELKEVRPDITQRFSASKGGTRTSVTNVSSKPNRKRPNGVSATTLTGDTSKKTLLGE